MRDIIAVVIRLIDDPDARESVWEWVLLVVLVFALIPVVGVIKGVGRILCKVFKAAAELTGAAGRPTCCKAPGTSSPSSTASAGAMPKRGC
ncbi:hypothetical protein FDU21_09995 [Xanthomonas oryzae pv. oryzae]|nr:hypothetical protein FDU21_09995 [Xanthomonas oryzae pv. oryzae]